MKKYILLLFSSFLLQADVVGQEVTYADDIAPLIYNHCSSCHRDGEIGPMPLTNYEEVRSFAQTIKFVTEIKYMPPWKADPDYSSFLGENFLSDDEIATIGKWVDDGMPRGEVANEPEFPDFPTGSILGTPDLVLEMAEPFTHLGNNRDNYRYFVIPSGLMEDKIVKTMEFRPGNPKIVHHALLFEDLTGEAAARDAATPEYGFDGFGSFNGDQASILTQKQFPGYVPGQKPIFLPDGIGQVFNKDADMVIQVHYAPWPVDEVDQSHVNVFFADDNEVIERELQSHIMVPLFNVINEDFFIAPNQIKEFHGRYTVPTDVSLVSISPHMHLLGKHWEVYLEKPNGERVNLIKIDDWDFNWQGDYSFDRLIHAPAGTVVHAIASYDNTIDNPNNPSNPPKFVTWGEGTEDEMYYLPISFVPYRDGDEDILLTNTYEDGAYFENKSFLYPITPNPVDDFTVVGFKLEQGVSLDIGIYDMQGRLVRKLKSNEFFNTGNHSINFSTLYLDSGVYLLNISSNKLSLSQKFVKG